MVVDLVFLGDVVLGLTLRASEIDDVSFTFFSHSVDYIRLVKWSWEREADASHPTPIKSGPNPGRCFSFGAVRRTRTDNLLFTKQLLHH